MLKIYRHPKYCYDLESVTRFIDVEYVNEINQADYVEIATSEPAPEEQPRSDTADENASESGIEGTQPSEEQETQENTSEFQDKKPETDEKN